MSISVKAYPSKKVEYLSLNASTYMLLPGASAQRNTCEQV